MSVLEVYMICSFVGLFGLLYMGSLAPAPIIRGPMDVLKLFVHTALFPLSWFMIFVYLVEAMFRFFERPN